MDRGRSPGAPRGWDPLARRDDREYPECGALSVAAWSLSEKLETVLREARTSECAVGLDVTIDKPRLDPDRTEAADRSELSRTRCGPDRGLADELQRSLAATRDVDARFRQLSPARLVSGHIIRQPFQSACCLGVRTITILMRRRRFTATGEV
jgi:hypothetical protein